MVEFDIADIKKNLPMAMTMAAFSGIAWYICVELNIRLFYIFKRRKGLYFWSCALCSWGIFTHALFIILADFQAIVDPRVSVPLIYVSWWFMVVFQSLVMYSRLHLVMTSRIILRCVLYMIIFTTVIISIPSLVTGPMSQQPTPSGRALAPFYIQWNRIENATWTFQETVISVLYIYYTQKHLRDTNLLSELSSSSRGGRKQMMRHLILTNILIIILEVPLLAIQYVGLFYLGGSFKPLVYGVKLRIEFSILNRLVAMTKARGGAFSGLRSTSTTTGNKSWVDRALDRGESHNASSVEGISRSRTNETPNPETRDFLRPTAGLTLDYGR
jgi:hypothetical protein